MKVVSIAERRRDPKFPVAEIEQVLDRLFGDAMREIFQVDPVYLIGELRNGWTDILKDYVGDSLRGLPAIEEFQFEGRGGFHLVWGEPPRVHLELQHRVEGHQAVFHMTTDGAEHRCRLQQIVPAEGASQAEAAAALLRRLRRLAPSPA